MSTNDDTLPLQYSAYCRLCDEAIESIGTEGSNEMDEFRLFANAAILDSLGLRMPDTTEGFVDAFNFTTEDHVNRVVNQAVVNFIQREPAFSPSIQASDIIDSCVHKHLTSTCLEYCNNYLLTHQDSFKDYIDQVSSFARMQVINGRFSNVSSFVEECVCEFGKASSDENSSNTAIVKIHQTYMRKPLDAGPNK